jgi:hypothetical protein
MKTYEKFFKNANGMTKKFGIFSFGLDRFILIDSTDVWTTLQTAQLLSSKLPTIVFTLPSDEVNNQNCLYFTLLNKKGKASGISSLSTGNQHPHVRWLSADEKLSYTGIPEDFKSDDKRIVLDTLKEFVNYVHNVSYAINITELTLSHFNGHSSFVHKFTNPEWYQDMSMKVDRSESKNGVFFELRQALYLSSTIEEAEQKIVDIWLEHSDQQQFLYNTFYNVLQKEIPESLTNSVVTDFNNFKPTTMSLHII